MTEENNSQQNYIPHNDSQNSPDSNNINDDSPQGQDVQSAPQTSHKYMPNTYYEQPQTHLPPTQETIPQDNYQSEVQYPVTEANQSVYVPIQSVGEQNLNEPMESPDDEIIRFTKPPVFGIRPWIGGLVFFLGILLGVAACFGTLIAYDKIENDGSNNFQISSGIKASKNIQPLLVKVEPATVAITVKQPNATGGSSEGSAGTGFVISADGYLVTNNHVVESSTGTVQIAFASGKTYDADIIGTDASEDLAVLKIDSKETFPFVELGNSDNIKVGDDAIAVGNALALEGGLSVARGIISGTNRRIKFEDGQTLSNLLQTDAAINHGNSGGPLVNSTGQVIGINTAGIDPSYAANIGFAINITHAKPIIEDLKKGSGKKVAYLGVVSRELDSTLVNQFNLPQDTGSYVLEIVEDGAADKAGLKVGDLIISLDGKAVDDPTGLGKIIREHKSGDSVKIVWYRNGEKKSATITFGERQEEYER